MKGMKTKRPLFALLAACVSLSVLASACSDGGAEEAADKETAVVHEGDMSTWPDAEFTIMVNDPNHQLANDDAPILQQVYEKTKVRLKVEVPPANVDEKLNMMLASQEYPDVLVIGNSTIAQRFIDGGHVIALDELIDKYGGQIKTNLGDALNKLRNADGHIYHLPSGYAIPGSTRYLESGNSFQLLTNVLEDKGWYKPQTFDDMYALLKEVKAKYPQYVPMTLALGDENYFNTMMDTLAGAEGARTSGDVVWTADDKLVYRFKDERIRDAVQWLNRLYQDGLLDKESPIQNLDGLKAKMAAEHAFSSIGHWFDTMYEANSIFNQDGKPFRFKYFLPKASADVDHMTYISYADNYNSGFYVTKKMDDPVRFMQFVNWLNTNEGNLAQYGIFNMDGEDKEGYDFYVTEENGKKVYKSTTFQINGWQTDEQFASKRGLGHFGSLTFSIDLKDPPNFPYPISQEELDFSRWWDAEQKRANEGFGESGTYWIEEGLATSWDATNITGLAVAPESNENVVITKVKQFAYNEIVRLITAQSDEAFASGYDSFLAQLESMNIGQWEAAINEAYSERKKQWSIAE